MKVSIKGWTFTWEGGEYIEIIFNGRPVECINVWDHHLQAPTIPVTKESLRNEATAWLFANRTVLSDYKGLANG